MMDLISMMEIGKFSITAITAITEVIPKVPNGLNFDNGNYKGETADFKDPKSLKIP
jgi:hypothetical protein